MQQDKIEIILCEGKSEMAYVQQLNRLLKFDCGPYYRPAFAAYVIGTGKFSGVKQKLGEVKRENPRTDIKIWLDKDLYLRDQKEIDQLNKYKSSFPPILFSIMNFEDFVALHCEDELLSEWIFRCEELDHFKVPLHSEVYEPEFRKLFPNYRKGIFPFELKRSNIELMFSRVVDGSCPIKNDFGVYLKKLMESGKLLFIEDI